MSEPLKGLTSLTAKNLETEVNRKDRWTGLADYGVDAEGNYYDKAFTWEPKKSNQFIMSIDGIPAYLVKASAKPSFANGEVTLDHINVKRYIKGKTIWNTIGITLYDAIIPSGAQSVMDWARLHHESNTGRDGYSSFYKKDVTLKQLSPLGEVIEEWRLVGTMIADSNFGALDWATEDAVNIEMTLRYDWAELKY
jgi:hypothetical protein